MQAWFIVGMVLAHFALVLPATSRLHAELKSIKVALLLVPQGMMQGVSAVRKQLREYMQQLRERGV